MADPEIVIGDGGAKKFSVAQATLFDADPYLIVAEGVSVVSLPTQKSVKLLDPEAQALIEQGFASGFARAMNTNTASVPLRILGVGNSGSMNISDGSRLLLSKTEVKVVSCTRWAEMQQTIIYHADLATLLHEPTVFRLLNDPGTCVGNQQFSVAESKLDISRDLGIARSIISNPLVAHILEIRQIGRQLQDREVPELTNYFNSSDFLELGCCVVIFLMCVSVSVVNTVHQRPIPFQLLADGSYVENQVNSQNFTGETIPDWLLLLLAIIVPLLFQLGLSKFYGSAGDMHSTACAYVLGLGQTYLTVEFVKLYVGYPRPNFYSLCQPSANYSVCTAEGSDSGRKAFPSGHAAIAFCGLSLLTFFIQHRFGVPSQATPPRKARVYSILSLAPMALATFIAASRVHDNMHFPADVVGGAVLGTALSFFSHSLWFPSLPM